MAIRDDAHNRDRQHLQDLAEQRSQVGFGGTQQRSRQQHLTREALANDPQHFIPDIWLQPVDGQHRAPLGAELLHEPWAVQHVQADQLFVALDQVSHAPLADFQLTCPQAAMNLGHAAVLAKALGAHGGDDVQANLAVGQRIGALLFGAVRPTEQRTAVGRAPTDLQAQPQPASEGQNRAPLPIARPERATASDALASMRDQRPRQGGSGLWMCASHGSAPQSTRIAPAAAKTGPNHPSKLCQPG